MPQLTIGDQKRVLQEVKDCKQKALELEILIQVMTPELKSVNLKRMFEIKDAINKEYADIVVKCAELISSVAALKSIIINGLPDNLNKEIIYLNCVVGKLGEVVQVFGQNINDRAFRNLSQELTEIFSQPQGNYSYHFFTSSSSSSSNSSSSADDKYNYNPT